jgi:hypothetical protein
MGFLPFLLFQVRPKRNGVRRIAHHLRKIVILSEAKDLMLTMLLGI